jgi:hypothetical protein
MSTSNREYKTRWAREKYQTDPEYRERTKANSQKWKKKNKDRTHEYATTQKPNQVLEWKMRALNTLGGPRCVHCGYDKDIRALQFDHINGDGHVYRKQRIGYGITFYKHIVETGGEGLQVLCANCNWIKRFECKEHNHKGRRQHGQRAGAIG